MISREIDSSTVKFIDSNGNEILNLGTLQTASFDSDVYYEGGSGMKNIFNRPTSYNITLENATFNDKFFSRLLNSDDKFKVVLKSSIIEKLKPIMQRTKNRRIRNKLRKRIEKLDSPFFGKELLINKFIWK